MENVVTVFRDVYPRGVGREISHIFKSGGVEGLVISTNLWRLDRQTVTRKAAIVIYISESAYARLHIFIDCS